MGFGVEWRGLRLCSSASMCVCCFHLVVAGGQAADDGEELGGAVHGRHGEGFAPSGRRKGRKRATVKRMGSDIVKVRGGGRWRFGYTVGVRG